MIIDKKLAFAVKKALAAGAFGDVVDLGKSGVDQGAGQPPLYLVVTTHGAVSGATITLAASDAPGMSSPATLLSTGAISASGPSLAFVAPLPSTAAYRRYLGVSVSGAASGTVSIFIAANPPAQRIYAAAPAS